MHTQALKYLNEERMLNIAMSEAVRRGNAEILSAERGAVLLREKNSGVYMLYARDYAPGEALLNLLLERDDVRELSVTRADLCRKAEELLGMRLAVMHNLWFYNHLMERIRDELDAGTFTAFHDRYVKLLDTRI